jgi:hypothetical protein
LLFCGLLFFAVRLRLILVFFAFRFLAMSLPPSISSQTKSLVPQNIAGIGGQWHAEGEVALKCHRTSSGATRL